MTLHGIDPDYATLGGMLLDPAQLEAVSEWLRPADFARPLCGEVYQLLTAMRATATPIDPVTVLSELRRAGRLRSDGYPAGELVAMIDTVPTPASTPYYARLVLEAATFRSIERCGGRISQVGRAQRGTPNDAFDVVAQAWRDLADTRDRWQRSTTPGSRSAGAERLQASDRVRPQAAATVRAR
jgi:replicative DNA helicase